MKKIVSVFLIMLISLSLAACRKNQSLDSSEDYFLYSFQSEEVSKKAKASEKEEKPESSFEETVSELESSGIVPEVTINDDNTVTFELPETTDEDKPVTEDEEPVITAEEIVNPEKAENISGGFEYEGKTYNYTSGQVHTALSQDELYYYSKLDGTRKVWYQKIDKAVKNLETELFLGVNLTKNNNYYIFYMYMMDHPEMFYLGGKISIYASSASPNAQGICFSYICGNEASDFLDCSYDSMPKAFKQKILSRKSVFDAEVTRIAAEIPSDAPDYIKEKMIYAKIISMSEYDASKKKSSDENPGDSWTAYGVIVNKTGVCESYSEAFSTLLSKVGIVSTGIVGTAQVGRITYKHKWNAVLLDDGWYACDPTFDDPINSTDEKVNFTFFNLSSWQIANTNAHRPEASFYDYPDCLGTKYLNK